MSILTDTAPRRIYLCVSDDEDHYDEPWPERYPEDDEITWSVDQPVACTVAYERADIVETLRQECDRAWQEVDAMARARDNAIKMAQDNAAEVERLRKIESAAQIACGLLWMIDSRGAKVSRAFHELRDAFGGPGSKGLGAAIQAAIDAGYEADHPPGADWWAGKNEST